MRSLFTSPPNRVLTRMMACTALISLPMMASAQDCLVPGSQECSGDIAVSVPAGVNTEFAQGAADLGSDGFDITVDGAPVAQDGTITAARHAPARWNAGKTSRWNARMWRCALMGWMCARV